MHAFLGIDVKEDERRQKIAVVPTGINQEDSTDYRDGYVCGKGYASNAATIGYKSERELKGRVLELCFGYWDATVCGVKYKTGHSICGASMRALHTHSKEIARRSSEKNLSILERNDGQRNDY